MEVNNSPTHAPIYLCAIREALPCVLSMLDREPPSKTFGCSDRVFWSWKFIDFPGARFQEIAYALAELAVNPTLLTNHSVAQHTLLHWAKAAIAFWQNLQHRDGSFDEAYPYERSLAATAFTGFYVGQAYLKIRNSYSTEEQTELTRVFQAAGNWLCSNDERHGILSNHLAAAAAALDTISQITLEDRFTQRCDYFINRILQHQSSEGWYEEYGGADPGYQTHTTFYLAYIWNQTKNKPLLLSLQESIRYFWHFVHVDGSIGGEYSSRNTRFFMPAGFEILAETLPEAAAVACFMRQSLGKQNAIGLHAMDQQNIFPLINNYLFAHCHSKTLDENTLLPLPQHTVGIKSYEKSGHLVLNTPNYQAIISTTKGGVLNAFAKGPQNNNALYSNAGVVIELISGKKASSQGLRCSKVKNLSDTQIEIESGFVEINQILMSPEKFIIFRLINLLFAPFPSFAYRLKNLLVTLLVRRKKPLKARLLRKITWAQHSISINDQIILDKPYKVKSVLIGGRFSAIHMGSARYFEWQELTHEVLPSPLSVQQVNALNKDQQLVINKQWSIQHATHDFCCQSVL